MKQEIRRILQIKGELLLSQNQALMMADWWSTVANIFTKDFNIEEVYHCLDWYTNIRTTDKLQTNGTFISYENEEISWFHFGLISHWSLLDMALPHINKQQAISLNNSLGQNSLHMLASSLSGAPRKNYKEMLAVIAPYCSVLEKDINGQTPIDILHYNLKNSSDDRQIKINSACLKDFEKLALFENLNKMKLTKKEMRNKI